MRGPGPARPGLRLRTLADVFAYAQAEGVELRLDATEVQVRRPPAGRGGRRAFVSGKKKQNTMKATVVADHQGRTLWTDALRPGRMHDATAARNEGIGTCFRHFRDVEVLLDDGYLGLRRDHPGQAVTPPRKGNKISPPEVLEARLRARHRHSSKRNTVGHALADHKAGSNWSAEPTAGRPCLSPTGPSPASSPTATPPADANPQLRPPRLQCNHAPAR